MCCVSVRLRERKVLQGQAQKGEDFWQVFEFRHLHNRKQKFQPQDLCFNDRSLRKPIGGKFVQGLRRSQAQPVGTFAQQSIHQRCWLGGCAPLR